MGIPSEGGMQKTSDALKKHADVDDKMTLQITDSLGRLQETYIINESGLYSLILSSKLHVRQLYSIAKVSASWGYLLRVAYKKPM